MDKILLSKDKIFLFKGLFNVNYILIFFFQKSRCLQDSSLHMAEDQSQTERSSRKSLPKGLGRGTILFPRVVSSLEDLRTPTR